ncbi:amidase [Tomitella biformata]|uniref:amidase n=1 Tax=Tomitella biformata TaxID=630403 RepID=UPI000464BF3F|nr:amidase [Tomitella biformata]
MSPDAPSSAPRSTEPHVHAFRYDALGRDDATEIARRIAAGEVSAREVAQAAIERTQLLQPALNAVAFAAYDRALTEADKPHTGVFAGVPTIIKDNIDVAGLPTNQGSAALDAGPAKKDGAFTRQLLSTGLVNLGKSRLPEFGFNASTEYVGADPVRNPWNPEYSAGASSGGSAALVAAGALPIAHANDGGGSIRIPAAACGLVGLKPSRGRMVLEDADRSLPIRIIGQGVLTRTVRDTARFFAGAEAYYRNPKLAPVRLVAGPAATRLRIGVIVDSITGIPTDGETRAAVAHTADLLAGLGHHVEEAAIPVGESFIEDFSVYWGFLSFAIATGGKQMYGPSFNSNHTDTLSKGLAVMYRKKMAKTPQVLYRLRRTYRQYAEMFQQFDVVLSPVVAHTTPEIGFLSPEQGYEELFRKLTTYTAFTPLNNASGGPAISLPLARSRAGLPIGMHFSADRGDERTLLELAFELEQAQPFALIQQM